MRQKSTCRSLRQHIWFMTTGLFVVGLSGCGGLIENFNIGGKTQAEVVSDAQAKELKIVRAALKVDKPKKIIGPSSNVRPVPVVAAASTVPTISAVGYSSIASQPGKNSKPTSPNGHSGRAHGCYASAYRTGAWIEC